MQYFIGISHSVGEMPDEKDPSRKINWDNILIERVADLDLEKKVGGGYVAMDPAKIRFEEWEEVSGGMNWQQLAQDASKLFMKPIAAMVMKGDNGKSENYLDVFRFCDENGKIKF